MSQQLSILQLITPSRYSGAERGVSDLSAALQRAGHRVVVATKANAEFEAQLRQRGVEVRVPGIARKTNLAAPLRIARLAREIDADLIHTHLSTASMWGSIAGRCLGLPVLAHVHALNKKHCFLLADRIVTPSEGVRQHLIAQGMAAVRIRVIHNGIPAERFTGLPPPSQIRRELDLPAGAPVLGVVAHLSPRKGHQYLLEAIARLDSGGDVQCLVVGEGRLRGQLEGLARQLGIAPRTHFVGYRDDATALMQVCDIVVLPSVAIEGFGMCLIEAAFLGIPTVGSRAPGIDEAIVDSETGLLVPPGDPMALAEAIERLLGEPELATRLGEAGRHRAHEMFTLERQAEATVALYREIITTARRPAGTNYSSSGAGRVASSVP